MAGSNSTPTTFDIDDVSVKEIDSLAASDATEIEDGYIEIFHSNGQLMEEGHINMGKREGNWNYYDVDGRLEKREDY